MMKINLRSNPLKKGLSLLLALLMAVTLLPLHLAKADDDTEPESGQDEEQPIVIQTENGEVTPEENWDEVYPFGTFAFGSYQADVAEFGATTAEGNEIPESIMIPVYRLGGTVGRATVRIVYAPAVTTNEDGSEKTYDYAASGKQDVLIEIEDPNPIAAYQQIGIPESERNMMPADVSVILPDPAEDFAPEDEVVLTLSEETDAEIYRWQARQWDGAWQYIDDALAPELTLTWKDIWDFEALQSTGYDFRCLMKKDGTVLCSKSMLGEVYEPIAEPDPIPEDLVIPEEPTYTALTFEDDWDIMEFDLTFAEGEEVKYIRFTAIDDEIPELPEFGLFTISECEGGMLSDTCNTLTVMVSDNDAHGESTLGFATEAISANREDGFALAKIVRSGDKTYNVTLHYETADGTAVAGVDYARTEGELAFAGSIDEIEIPVELIANDDTEEKSFEIVLSELRGGGTNQLCKFERERITVTISGTAKEPEDDGSGMNLATLLGGMSGKDISDKVVQGEEALLSTNSEPAIKASVTMEDQQGLEANFVTEPATRSHEMGAYYLFSRDVTSSDPDAPTPYSNGNFWHDWDDMVGDSTNVYNGLDVARSDGRVKLEATLDSDGSPSNPWFYAKNGTRTLNNKTYNTGYADANYRGHVTATFSDENKFAGEYYDRVAMSFGWVLPGVREVSGLLHNRYLRPEITVKIGSWKDGSRMFDVDTDTDNGDWRPDNWEMYARMTGKGTWEWTDGHYDPGYQYNKKYNSIDGPNLNYDEDFEIKVNFQFYLTWTHREASTYNQQVTHKDHTSKFDFRAISGRRRVFTSTNSGINLVLYTVNDKDNAGEYTQLKDETLYKQLAPIIRIVPGEGGVNENGQLYVGTKLEIDFSKVPSHFVIANDGIKLTGTGYELCKVQRQGDSKVFTCTLMPATTLDKTIQNDKFTLHVCYNRVQTVTLFVGPSSERNSDGITFTQESAYRALEKMIEDTDESEFRRGFSVETSKFIKHNGDGSIYFDTTAEAGIRLTLDHFNEKPGELGKYIYDQPIVNLQTINFHQDPGDYIVYNKKSYAGDQDIPILAEDMSHTDLEFIFYDSAYLEALSIMTVSVDHVEVYFDADHNDRIDGELDDLGFFHVAKDSTDRLVMRASGDYPDSDFRPETDSDGHVYQYFIKVFLKRTPRAFDAPEGYDTDRHAQLLPAFISAITDPDALKNLTSEQRSYRYVRAQNTDDRVMFGDQATGIEYIDFPLGGDIGSITMDVKTNITYEADGVTVKDVDEEKVFTWDPKFVGNLLIPFEAPKNITDSDNVTGGDVSLAVADPSTQIGKDNLNAYLGAFVGRSTFAIGIQEQSKALLSITSLSDLTPEAVTVGTVRTVPSSDSLMNMKSGGSPGQTSGTSPDIGSDFKEFKQDLGVELPSMELGLGDYATIIMDGYQVGFAIGIPLYKNEKSMTFGEEMADGSHKSVYTDDFDNEHTVIEKTNETTKTKTTRDSYNASDPSDPTNKNKRVQTVVVTTEDANGNISYHTEKQKQEFKNGNWVNNGQKEESDTAPETPSRRKRDTAKKRIGDANGQLGTLGGFISACRQGQGKGFFTDAFSDDTLNAARNGRGASRKMSVSFTVQIAIMFEFNPIDNCHYFKNAGISASLGFEFTLQLRFTPCPIFYLYIKFGVEISAGIGLSCYRKVKEGPVINDFLDNGGLYQLAQGKTVRFKLDMRKSSKVTYRGFLMDIEGDVLMKVFTSNDPNEEPDSMGLLLGDGSEKEVILKPYDCEVYIELTPYSKTVKASNLRAIEGAESKVVFDGFTLTPSLSMEAGIGAGIELLKIEAFFKISTSMALKMGGYLEETDSYEGFYIDSFEGSIAVGINISAMFFNYTLDAIAFGFTGEQHGTRGYFSWHISCSAVNGSYDLWSEDCYTSADGKTLDGEPKPPQGVNIFTDNSEMTFYDANGIDISDEEANPSTKDWKFRSDVLAWRWSGGKFLGEIPQNADLAEANKSGVSVVFETTAPQINLYFSGDIEVHNTRTGATKSYSSSPAKLNFGSGEGANTVTITCSEGAKLDRYEIPNRGIGHGSGFETISEGNGKNLVHISGPTDISGTQRIRSVKDDTRAFTPGGTSDFQLSGYNTSGSATELIGGLTTGYDYKLVMANGENYVVFPLMIDQTPQLVLSRLVMTGDLSSQTGLAHPTDSESSEGYLLLDNDGLMDHDFDVKETENGLLVSWVTFGDAKGDTFKVKQRLIPLTEGATLSDPVELSSGSDACVLPLSIGSGTAWVSASGTGEQDNLNLRTWLIKTHPGLTDEMLNSGTTDVANLASSVFTWNTQSAVNQVSGNSSILHYKNGETELTMPVENGERIQNIETAKIGSETYILFTTSQVAYFDVSEAVPSTVGASLINEDTEQGNIYRLYLTTLEGSGFAEPMCLKTVIDFSGCTEDTIDSAELKDGVYSQFVLETAKLDPYFANLKFVTADIDGTGEQTLAMFEMNGNTWLLKQADLEGLPGGGNAELIPIFNEVTGTEVTIGADNEYNLCVVYTAPVSDSQSNAIFAAWWDKQEQKWGAPVILAMRNLQVYEDRMTGSMTPEEAADAYLGISGSNASGETPKKLTFSNLQMTTRKIVTDDETREQLTVLTTGSMTELVPHTFVMGGGKEDFKTYVPDPNKHTELGVYAIAFGAGDKAIGEGRIELSNYDFAQGSKLVGNVSFRNTGTTAIRASEANPMNVQLIVNKKAGGILTLAEWNLMKSIESGAEAQLYFDSFTLTESLSEGDQLLVKVTEHSYFAQETEIVEGEVQPKPFSTLSNVLLEVDDLPELMLSDFDVSVLTVEGTTTKLKFITTVVNAGSKPAEDVYLQFSYDTGRVNEDGEPIFNPINIAGSAIETSLQQHRAIGDIQNGIYRLSAEDGTNIDQDCFRTVSGTLCVPTECFISTESKSGLHLHVEVYSKDDKPHNVENVYSSDHKEYNNTNNSIETTIKHTTEFYVPSRINTALGTTLTLPVRFNTTGDAPDIVLTEVTDGTEDWEPCMGICYYDAARGVIVAAPNARAKAMLEAGETPTGILQLRDVNTNSIAAITYKVGAMSDGVNIYRDDTSFSFHNANGSDTNLYAAEAEKPGWLFLDKSVEIGWTGGDENEIPMNNDLTMANEDGAYFTFDTVADTLEFYFMGSITVETEPYIASKTFTESPAMINLENAAGETYTVKVTAKKGTRIDRYVPTYKINTVVDTDADAPQILWNRSFPEIASILTDSTTVPMTCYIVDATGVLEVSFNDTRLDETTTPCLVRVSDNLCYFDYTFTGNDEFNVTAYDVTGNMSQGDVRVKWFNEVPTGSAIATAPELTREDLDVVDDEGDPIGSDIINYPPWLVSSYKLLDDETSEAHLFADGTFSNLPLDQVEGEQRWQAVMNGIYLVQVDRDDGTWARAIIQIDNMDMSVPILTVKETEGTIEITASDDKEIKSLTVNEYPIKVSGKTYFGMFPIDFGGDYTVTVTDDAGNTESQTVHATVPVTFEAEKIIECANGNISGSLSVAAADVRGGDYDPSKSDPEHNVYMTDYEIAVVSGETTEPPTEGWSTMNGDFILAAELGTYTLFVRDMAGNVSYQTIELVHDFEWDVQEYVWTETSTGYTVTGTAICTNDPTHIVTETVEANYAVVTAATTRKDGLARYTATFTDEHFTTQTMDIILPMLLPTFYGENVEAFDVISYIDGRPVYRYDVRIKNVDRERKTVGGQVYISYDKNTLQFVDAVTEMEGEIGIHAFYKGVLAFGWASAGDGVTLKDGDVILSLYFELLKPVADGTVLTLTFPEENNGFKTGLAFLSPEGEVEDAESVLTEDGSIAFNDPKEITIAGEDVYANDIYVVEDGEMLYPYHIRVNNLPEAGILVNSMQIFLNCDSEMLELRKTEGPVEWTVTENGKTLMAAWASETEVLLENDDVVLTLWFAKKEGTAPGVAQITFTVNALGNASELSLLFAGRVLAAEAHTVDGSIIFEAIVYGDANCDGQITAADAALILRMLVGLSELTPRGLLHADVDGNGEITAADAALILRYVIRLIDSFPAENP